MALTSYSLSRVRAVVDESSLERLPGAQIDWASITADADGAKRVKAGTVVSRKADGKVQPRSFTLTLTSVVVASNVATATGTIVASRVATEILETDATDLNMAESYTGYGALVAGVLYENLLPDATGTPKVLPSQYKTELVSAGCTFKFRQFADTRAS